MTRKEQFMELMKMTAIKGMTVFYFGVKMKDFPQEELIVNHVDNLDKKLEYIDKTYNDDMKHASGMVEITSFGHSLDMTTMPDDVIYEFDEEN
ncbi:hypothetical protein [Bacillus mycoides]|uniref:Phage protein n=1 Tax=Bacillus mycoides (strain KBAB4) TaxID=315730 RepID=A9VVI1_BACMK|nr:hypothetical protein [Bacillus mycoides]ABY46796.1 hypothetical protein BcerKBAB4_5302 [Bacillus mycoides KBAB4]